MTNILEFPARVPGVPRRGEVYQWAGRTVVVISGDNHNSLLDPWVLALSRGLRGSAYAVDLDDTDPFGGRVIIHPVMIVPQVELTRPLGMLTGATLDRVKNAVISLISDD